MKEQPMMTLAEFIGIFSRVWHNIIFERKLIKEETFGFMTNINNYRHLHWWRSRPKECTEKVDTVFD